MSLPSPSSSSIQYGLSFVRIQYTRHQSDIVLYDCLEYSIDLSSREAFGKLHEASPFFIIGLAVTSSVREFLQDIRVFQQD